MNFLKRFKNKLDRSFKTYGLHVYTDRSLPYGIDLMHDIARCQRKDIECVFDVGANIGQSVFRFHPYWPNARIFCFEPVKQTFHQLIDNTHGFPNVRCENIALGASRGIEIIWLQNKGSCWNSLKAENNREEMSIGQIEEVEIITLDEFCIMNKVSYIDFLKIDVEGYELEVLKGSKHMLNSHAVQFIYAETTFHLSDSQHTPITSLTDYLEPFSYKCLGIYDKKLRFNTLGQPAYLRWSDALFKLQE